MSKGTRSVDNVAASIVERRVIDPAIVEQLMAQAGDGELLGPDGLLTRTYRQALWIA